MLFLRLSFLFFVFLLPYLSFSSPFEVETLNVLGVLRVVSAATNTIVSVPWTACSARGDESVCVADLVRTQGLVEGDQLHLPDNTGLYASWRLVDGCWKAQASISRAGLVDGVDAGTATMPRGASFLLVRHRPRDERGQSIPFYLVGQVSESVVRPVIRAGSPAVPIHHLVSNPLGRAIDVNALDWTGSMVEDTIVIPSGSASGVDTILTFTQGKWGYWDSQRVWDPRRNKYKIQQTYVTKVEIPAGTGFWYVSRGGSPAPTWR